MKIHNVPIGCIIKHRLFAVHSSSNLECPLFLKRRKKCNTCIGRADVQRKQIEIVGKALSKGFADGIKKGGVIL